MQYSNGTIAASNASFSVQGSTADIGLTNATAIANNNTLLETNVHRRTMFNAQASTLQGVISTATSGTSTVNLTQGTVWTMTGNSNATSVTNDASQIVYTPPTGDPTQLASYKTLTAMNYTGVGGTIQLNTFLGDDSAPSDRLIINGGAANRRDETRYPQHGRPRRRDGREWHSGCAGKRWRDDNSRHFRPECWRIAGRRF